MVAEHVSGREESQNPLAVLILGPTGSGKTALSLALAQEFQGEIVSCDSVAVYRGMDIGSAKPTIKERAQAPHHLIDVANPDEPFTAGEYSRQARAAMREISHRGHLPIVTGGTGLYLRALTLGLAAAPARQPEIREHLMRSHQRHSQDSHSGRHSRDWLHHILMRVDPESAARIHANDIPKLIRALEIRFFTGQPLSTTLASDPQSGRDPLTGFRLLRIGLNPPRQSLYERLNRRAATMFELGLIEETRSLLASFGRVPALEALGYRQALAVLNNEIDGVMTESEAIAAAQQGHRNYAKRQLTWFRREPDFHWIEDFGDAPATIAAAIKLVAQQNSR